MATPSALAYGVRKAGVQQLGKTLAIIGTTNDAQARCNTLHPGMIKTRMSDNIMTVLAAVAGSSAEQAEKLALNGVPFTECGRPIDVAHMALFLASDESSYVTGFEIKVDGGWLLRNAG